MSDHMDELDKKVNAGLKHLADNQGRVTAQAAIALLEPLRLALSAEIDLQSIDRAVDPSEEHTAADEYYEALFKQLDSMDELLAFYREKLIETN